MSIDKYIAGSLFFIAIMLLFPLILHAQKLIYQEFYESSQIKKKGVYTNDKRDDKFQS